MSSLQRIKHGISGVELGGWLVAGLASSFFVTTRTGGTLGSDALNETITLCGLACLPLPLRLLQLFGVPHAPALRRFLGEPMGQILSQTTANAARVVGAWCVGAVLSLPAMAAWASLLGAEPVGIVNAAIMTLPALSLLASVGVFSVWAMVLSLHQVAGGDRQKWQNMTGGGAFGPTETAPMLYAPAFGFTVGLAVPVFCMTIASALVDENLRASPIGHHLIAYPWIAAAIPLSLAACAVATARSATRVPARVALLHIEAAHAQGFYRSEHLAAPHRLLTIAGTTAATETLAKIWHRRFPASIMATTVMALASAWAMRGSSSAMATALACAAISLYSAGRAHDLSATLPTTFPTLRFLGATDVARSLRELSFGLLAPSATALLIAWTTGNWAASIIGLAVGAALALVPSARVVVPLVRVAPVALIAVALAAGELP